MFTKLLHRISAPIQENLFQLSIKKSLLYLPKKIYGQDVPKLRSKQYWKWWLIPIASIAISSGVSAEVKEVQEPQRIQCDSSASTSFIEMFLADVPEEFREEALEEMGDMANATVCGCYDSADLTEDVSNLLKIMKCGVGRNSDGTLATNSYDDDDDSESEIRAYCELSCTDASCSTTSENIETNNSNGLHYYTSTVPDDPEPFKFSCNWVEGEGYLTTFTTTLPDSPTDLSVNGITQAQINLAWTDNSDNETGFKIERNGSMINTTDADANSYSDSSVSCGTTYNYSVKATNAVGDSSEITISATTEKCSTSGTPATVLPPELNVSIKFKGEGTVNLDSRVCKSDNEECKYSLKVAKHYSLKATPAAGYEFDRWSGSSTCSDGDIFLIKNTVCQAIFKEKVSETANSAGSSSNSDSSSGSTGNGIISDNFRPVNISTRAKLMGGANNAVAGFILQGSGQQTVMLQGLALENLVDPVITVNKFPSGDLVATNDNWQDAENADKIPENLKLPKITDAGLLLDLRAGGYTINFGSNNESGIGLVSVNLVADENSKYTNDLINLSTRASIQGGANDVIAGFIINGNDTQKVLIIARGLDEGVDTTLKLQKYPSGDTVAENDDWQNADNSGDITVSLNDTDAALLLDLPAGAYTAVMSSNGKKGLGIVEVNIVQ